VHLLNWRSTADRCAALLIRIRIVILSAARFARSPSEHFAHGVTQCCAVLYIVARAKEASEASGLSIFYTPMGELIGILYINIGFRNFCQFLSVERHDGDDNSGVPVQ